MGSNQLLGKKFSQSAYITFYELDNLFLHVAREGHVSRDRTSGQTGRCLFKPRAVSQFIHHRHAGKRRKSHPEAAGPPGAYGQARAARTGRGRGGQGRTGQGRDRAGPPSASGPRQAAAPAKPEQAQHQGERRGREFPTPGCLEETTRYLSGSQRDGPARPVSFPRARPIPTPPYLPAAAAQPGLAPGKAPPPPPLLAAPPHSSAPIGRVRTGAGPRPCPLAQSALAAFHPGNARPGSRDGRGARGCRHIGENPPREKSSKCFTSEPQHRTARHGCTCGPQHSPAGAPGGSVLSTALTGEGRAAAVATPFPTPKRALMAPMGTKPRDSQGAFSVRVPQRTAPSGLVSLAHKRTSRYFP